MLKPDFLIIGAMKAGTTTLHRDLVGHPDIFLPQDKEPETLVKFHDDRAAILADYASLFRPAKSGQLLGEASTAYTKRPDYEGVAQRAFDICGPDLKIIYLTREPVARIISQFKHEYGLGLVEGPMNEAVVKHHRFVEYSRYGWQLDPWQRAFGEGNVLVLSFEEYIADRTVVVGEVCRFLGVDPAKLASIQADKAFNASDGKKVPKGMWKTLVSSGFYQRLVKPLIPWGLRNRLATVVLSAAPQVSETLSPERRRQIEERLAGTPLSAE